MLELINFANYDQNRAILGNSASGLQALLGELGVDGVEALFCDPWDEAILPAALVHGVHLNFWPIWLDFWRGDQQALARQFGSQENVLAYFGGTDPDHMVACYRRNIEQAIAVSAKYVVFHVSHNEMDEIYTWRFRADSQSVIDAAIELVNAVVDMIPPDMEILFENLWWPGLTLLEPRLVDRLLSRIRHPKAGLMLDTGHLMNTNPDLEDERQGADYVLAALNALGSLRQAVRGIHLHQSLSGGYVKASRCRVAPVVDLATSMAHIMRIDQHRPFGTPAAKRIVEFVRPAYLVHEFIFTSKQELIANTARQRQALR